jgi:hypothetical protein
MEINEKQKEILECMFKAWTENGMPLYGRISIQCAWDFMQELGIDTTESEKYLEELEAHYRKIAKEVKND